MTLKNVGFAAAALVVALGLTGCGKGDKKEPSAASANSNAPAIAVAQPAKSDMPEAVIRLRWLGKKGISADTNSAGLMRLWNEPSASKLEEETLDKLASYYAHFVSFQSDSKIEESASSALRPLLDEVLQQPGYLEVQGGKGEPWQWAAAIHLEPARAAFWETNLASTLKLLTGHSPEPGASGQGGWALELTNSLPPASSSARRLTLAHAGDWTVLGLSPKAQGLAADFCARINRDHSPFAPPATNFWLNGELDLAGVFAMLGLTNSGQDFPKLEFNVLGDGMNVRTHGMLTFQGPVPTSLSPWAIPTNLVEGPLIGLTTVRDIGPLFRRLPPFASLPPQAVPDQLCVWHRGALPFETFFALHTAEASNTFSAMAPPLRDLINPRLGRNYGAIEIETNVPSLTWPGLSHASPFFKAVTNSDSQYIFGGFGPPIIRTNHIPAELLQHILEGTNLVYFDWEITGEAVIHWRYLDDVYRLLFDAHGPRLNDTPSLNFIGGNLTNLSHSVTEVKLAGTNTLSFARKSTVGLTGLELDLLANWLESPDFPRNLASIMATNPAPVVRIHRRPNRP